MKHAKLAAALAVLLACTFIVATVICTQPPPVKVPEEPEPDWIAEPHSIIEPQTGSEGYGYTPTQIKTAYNLPVTGGAGTTIAVIVAYDTPDIQTNLATFSAEFSLPAPDSSNFEVHKMESSISQNSVWTKEASLNVEWAHAIAPEAKILLVEAANDSGTGLFAAIDYATARADVDVISMSWGIVEVEPITAWDSHFNVADKVFFASAGNTPGEVYWPACSPYVVSVGGTTLTLNPDNSVASEIGWYKGGGGVSIYESMPQYQTDYGLSGSMRCVPDVSYSADSTYGYPIYYNGAWTGTGGTSAAAPQWAAIYAIGTSVDHESLYRSAKTVTPLPFRDITEGNYTYPAGAGYDYVTGLGSPITVNFDFKLDAVPTHGPGAGAVSLNGEGFSTSSKVDLEYLNPLTSTWTPIVDNYPNPSGTFSYGTTAVDLQQVNPAGDKPAQHNDIICKATDNGDGRTVTTAASYMEMQRGIAQVDTAVASGIFGDGSDLTTPVLVGNSESVTLIGKWFKPGSVTLTWDGTENLGSAAVNGLGDFSGSFTVPEDATDGTHTITVYDGVVSLSFTLSSSSDPPELLPVPEGPEFFVFTATLAGAALAVWIKRK